MKKLIVLPKHKYHTIDTVTPILLEFSSRAPNKIEIFFPKYNDLVQLKKNFVLHETLNSISKIKLFGHKNFFLHKIIKIYYLFYFTILALLKNKFIHFGELDYWPFKIISLINKDNVFFCESSPYFDNYDKFAALAHDKGNFKNVIKNNDWTNVKSISCRNIIVNDERNYYSRHPKHKNKNFFVYGASRLSDNWIKHSKKYEDELFIQNQNIKKELGYIVFVLTTFVPYRDFKDGNSQINLFKDTLEVLNEMQIPSLIKPHYFTQMETVKKELKNYKNIYISYAHPTVLALNAKAWICNIFSTTCADAFGIGVPTIEYTEYSQNLKKYTNNSSLTPEFIDYFISRDKKKLKETLETILSKSFQKKQRIFATDKNNLISRLTQV